MRLPQVCTCACAWHAARGGSTRLRSCASVRAPSRSASSRAACGMAPCSTTPRSRRCVSASIRSCRFRATNGHSSTSCQATAPTANCSSRRAATTSSGCARNGAPKRISPAPCGSSPIHAKRCASWRPSSSAPNRTWKSCSGGAGMSSGEKWCVAPLACVLLVAAACSPHPPAGSTPEPEQAVNEVCGGWVHCEDLEGKWLPDTGELLAVGADTLWLYSDSAGGVRAMPLATIGRAEVYWYDRDTEIIGLWTTLGVISTLSHGVGLVFSAPVWLAFGLAAAGTDLAASRVQIDSPDFGRLRPYARFPAGWPPGLEWRRVEPRPRSTSN